MIWIAGYRRCLSRKVMAMEATIFTGWIYDQLVPHTERVKVAHPVMLGAIAASSKEDRSF
jgi:hypothetical protein